MTFSRHKLETGDRRASTIAPEVERLLGEQTRLVGIDGRIHEVKGRVQKISENGETLKYIESVLRQLRRASRDHRQLVEQRHRIDAPRTVFKSSTTRACPSTWIPYGQGIREHRPVSWDAATLRGTWDEPREMTEFAKLLAKRKTYGSGFDPYRTSQT